MLDSVNNDSEWSALTGWRYTIPYVYSPISSWTVIPWVPHLCQLLTAQTAVLVSVYILEHCVHQDAPLAHGVFLPVHGGPGLHVQQHALQLVVLRHGARVACKAHQRNLISWIWPKAFMYLHLCTDVRLRFAFLDSCSVQGSQLIHGNPVIYTQRQR